MLVSLLEELFAIESDFDFDAKKHRQGLRLMMDGCRKHKCIRVAEYNNRVIGMCSAQTLISTVEGRMVAMVEDFVIQKQWQGKGIGRMLLENIELWSKICGLTRLQLLADSGNTPALKFYRKNGWEPTQLICIRKRLR